MFIIAVLKASKSHTMIFSHFLHLCKPIKGILSHMVNKDDFVMFKMAPTSVYRFIRRSRLLFDLKLHRYL